MTADDRVVLWQRLPALAVDFAALTVVVAVLVGILPVGFDRAMSLGLWWMVVYRFATHLAFGKTLGKYVMNISVVWSPETTKRVRRLAARDAIYFVPRTALDLVYAVVAFPTATFWGVMFGVLALDIGFAIRSRDRATLHDRLVGSLVVSDFG